MKPKKLLWFIAIVVAGFIAGVIMLSSLSLKWVWDW